MRSVKIIIAQVTKKQVQIWEWPRQVKACNQSGKTVKRLCQENETAKKLCYYHLKQVREDILNIKPASDMLKMARGNVKRTLIQTSDSGDNNRGRCFAN